LTPKTGVDNQFQAWFCLFTFTSALSTVSARKAIDNLSFIIPARFYSDFRKSQLTMHVLRNFSLVRLRNTRAFSRNRLIITDEVKTALTESKPVVALESTIVTHGMPFPSNVECALEVENVVRSQVANLQF